MANKIQKDNKLMTQDNDTFFVAEGMYHLTNKDMQETIDHIQEFNQVLDQSQVSDQDLLSPDLLMYQNEKGIFECIHHNNHGLQEQVLPEQCLNITVELASINLPKVSDNCTAEPDPIMLLQKPVLSQQVEFSELETSQAVLPYVPYVSTQVADTTNSTVIVHNHLFDDRYIDLRNTIKCIITSINGNSIEKCNTTTIKLTDSQLIQEINLTTGSDGTVNVVMVGTSKEYVPIINILLGDIKLDLQTELGNNVNLTVTSPRDKHSNSDNHSHHKSSDDMQDSQEYELSNMS